MRWQRRFDAAIGAFKRGLAFEGNTELWSGLGDAYAVSGNRGEAQKVLDELHQMSARIYVAPGLLVSARRTRRFVRNTRTPFEIVESLL